MWIVKPNYNKSQICFYCGKNEAVKEKENETTLYKIVGKGKITLSVDYVKLKVGIPRCNECYKRHGTAGLPTGILFFVGIICGIVYYIFWGVPEFMQTPSNRSAGFLGTLVVIGTLLLVWLVACAIVGAIIRLIINAFMKGTKDEEDNEDYPPIKKLIGIGFMKNKPDAAAHYGTKIDNNKQKLQEVFNSIINDDNCSITNE